MEIHDTFIDNSVSDSWFESTLSYGGGDNGSPESHLMGHWKQKRMVRYPHPSLLARHILIHLTLY